MQGANLGNMLEDEEFRIHPGLKQLWTAFFARKTGRNFRNDLLHGRVSDEHCNHWTAHFVFLCFL